VPPITAEQAQSTETAREILKAKIAAAFGRPISVGENDRLFSPGGDLLAEGNKVDKRNYHERMIDALLSGDTKTANTILEAQKQLADAAQDPAAKAAIVAQTAQLRGLQIALDTKRLNADPVDSAKASQLNNSYQFNDKQLEAISTPIAKKAEDIGTLSDLIAQHSPAADALIAPKLLTLMAGGQGSGLRMNEAEISRIVGGRSAWEGLRASLLRWSVDPSKANSITEPQRQQMQALVAGAEAKVTQKRAAITQARQALIDAGDVTTHRQTLANLGKQLDAIDAASGGSTIKMRAPNGQVKEVSPNEVEHYKSLGATVEP
jgi:hypothetical protein